MQTIFGAMTANGMGWHTVLNQISFHFCSFFFSLRSPSELSRLLFHCKFHDSEWQKHGITPAQRACQVDSLIELKIQYLFLTDSDYCRRQQVKFCAEVSHLVLVRHASLLCTFFLKWPANAMVKSPGCMFRSLMLYHPRWKGLRYRWMSSRPYSRDIWVIADDFTNQYMDIQLNKAMQFIQHSARWM